MQDVDDNASHKSFQELYDPRELDDPEYRHNYLAAHTQQLIAAQVRALRGSRTQEAFATQLGMTQQQVSQLERGHAIPSARTLLRIAAQLDCAVIIGLIDFPTFLQIADHMRTTAMPPKSYSDHC